MSEAAPGSTSKQKLVRKFADHVRGMPAWHKRVLWLSIGLTVLGAAAQTVGYFRSARSTTLSPAGEAPEGSRSVVATDNPPTALPDKESATWSQWLSQTATKVGVSFVAGFVIGWIFRAFIKTMLLVSVLGVGVLVALSYFGVPNVDFSNAREKYESGMSWVSGQAGKIKDAAMGHIPSAVPAIFGAFVGMRRK